LNRIKYCDINGVSYGIHNPIFYLQMTVKLYILSSWASKKQTTMSGQSPMATSTKRVAGIEGEAMSVTSHSRPGR